MTETLTVCMTVLLQASLTRLSLSSDTQVKVWMNKYGWTENEEGQIFIFNQEESVKPKNIVEKIDFESECCCLNGETQDEILYR